MRGYYYDNRGQQPLYTAPRPPRTPTPSRRPRGKKRRGAGLAIAVFSVVVVLQLAVGLGLSWRFSQNASGVEIWVDNLPEDVWQGEQESQTPAETTVKRAPNGDGTTLTIVGQPAGAAHSFQQIYGENIASIVSIRAISKAGLSFGTGVVMSADGYIITNAHVIEGSRRVQVVLEDGTEYDALLAGMDTPTDLAVLKIEAQDLSPAVFGDSSLLQVGDTVLAIGNPLGEELRGTMTDGIISAINRDVEVDGNIMSLLQTTAALNSGNSGGALINQYGQVIGITNLKMQSYSDTVEGLGFAIPTSTVKTVVDQLIAQGYVSGRPTIGITVRQVSQEQQAEGLPQGVRVEEIQPGSDAEGKLELGDVIVEANGSTITSIEDLVQVKETLGVGDSLFLRLWRDGTWLEREILIVEQYTLES